MKCCRIVGSGGGGDWERVLQRAVAAVRRGDGEGPGIFRIFLGFSVFGSTVGWYYSRWFLAYILL